MRVGLPAVNSLLTDSLLGTGFVVQNLKLAVIRQRLHQFKPIFERREERVALDHTVYERQV